MANSQSGESLLKRIVKIISDFETYNTTRSPSALARRTGIPLTTTYRLVRELVNEGLLARDDDDNIRLGVKLWEFGSRSSLIRLREYALPFMEDVQTEVRQHTTLGVLDHDELLYIERIGLGSPVVSIASIAARLPAHASSSGLVLLAHAPLDYQDAFLQRTLPKLTNNTITNSSELRRRLAEIRQVGYAFERGVIVPESSGVAVPVRDRTGDVVAALSVIVPQGEENIPTTVPVLKTAARGISRSLGWRG